MPQVATALSVAAIVGGSFLQAKGVRDAAKAEAALYQYNAALDRREAQQRRTASLDEQGIRREQLQKELKRRRAVVAKRGIQLRGSPLLAQLETAQVMAADIANLAFGRELEARGLEQQATINEFSAGAARQAGRLGVATALVGGVSDISRLGIQRFLRKQ